MAKWIRVHTELRANTVEDPKVLFLGGLTSCVSRRVLFESVAFSWKHLMAT